MAVYAAHLTRTLQGTPSIFEISAQLALGATVKPALRRVAEYLAAVYPKKFEWLDHWYDEVYLLADVCLQYHYLKHYAASFSEHFYGLVRVPVRSQSEFGGSRLPPTLEKGSLLMLTVAEYVRDKAIALINRWREMEEDGVRDKYTILRKWLRRIASVCLSVICWCQLIRQCRWLLGADRGTVWGPTVSLWMLGLTLKTAPDAPPVEHDSIFPRVSSYLLSAVQHGAFLIQLAQHVAAAGGASAAAAGVVTPPTRPPRAVATSNRCPICLQKWKTPAALPVSGFVFCYTCISRSLRNSSKCPVTGLPASETSLVRLYLQ